MLQFQHMTAHKLFWLVTSMGILLGLIIGVITIKKVRSSPAVSQQIQQIEEKIGLKKPAVIGFMPYWLLNKTHGNYPVSELAYFSLTINPDGSIQQFTRPSESEPGRNKLAKGEWAQKKNSLTKQAVQQSLVIQMINEAHIAQLINQPLQNAQALVQNVSPLMKEHQFNDLNLDIESFREASPAAQVQFTSFVSEVKKQLQQQQLGTLTVEVAPIAFFAPRLIDPVSLGEVADRVVIMGYDYHYRDSFVTGPVAPLGGAPEVREFDVKTTLDQAIKDIPANKIILALPLYGYEWETISQNNQNAVIPGTGKTATNRRVEDELLPSCASCTAQFDELSKSPFVIIKPSADQLVSQQIWYENQASLTAKIKLAEDYKLQGIALWALGYESEKIMEPVKDYQQLILWP